MNKRVKLYNNLDIASKLQVEMVLIISNLDKNLDIVSK